MKLFLKGDRCYTDKCGYERRAYAPGQHGQNRRRKASDYGEQLREKQKVKRIYGIAERQFRGYYFRASRMKGVTGENLLVLLERRLDNIVYRLGFAGDHAEARQLVRHGHFTINGSRVNIPSYLVRINDQIQVVEKRRKINRVIDSLGAIDRRGVPQWLELDKEAFRGRVKAFPSREDFTLPIREQLIVELYSK
jgi:small subunit ribosomal protein S4